MSLTVFNCKTLISCVLVASAVCAEDKVDYSWAPITNKTILQSQRSSISPSRCLTPSYNPGTCVPVIECPGAVALLKKQPLTEQIKSILARSLCYAYRNQDPVICCPTPRHTGSINSQTTTLTSTTSTSTTSRPSTGDPLLNHQSARLLPIGDCGVTSLPRIFGGTETQLGEFPWAALLKYSKRGQADYLCGGTLISNRYVITAAHCAGSYNLPLVAVRIGEHNIKTDPDCLPAKSGNSSICSLPVQEIPIEQFIPHQLYDPNNPNSYDDIALVRLKFSARFHDYVQPVCLPFGDVDRQSLVGKPMSAAGWGRTEKKGGSDVLLKVTLAIDSFEHCSSVFRGQVNVDKKKQLCAGGEAGKDTCNGDSGGPLMSVGKNNNEWYLQGVVSIGPLRCGQAGWPGIYTRVSNYLGWVLDNIRD